jgi:hypothetical protein
MQMTEDLHVARRRAEDASRAKSQFLAMISHELRTPFTGIRGMADLMAGTRLDGEQTRYLDVMRRSIERLLALLDQLLDFSRIEAGRIEIAELPMAPARLVADVLTTFAPGAQAKGLGLHRSIAADVPVQVVGDPAKTSQILANLVGNAVKFTERGQITVALAVETARDGSFLTWASGHRDRLSSIGAVRAAQPPTSTSRRRPGPASPSQAPRRRHGGAIGPAIGTGLALGSARLCARSIGRRRRPPPAGSGWPSLPSAHILVARTMPSTRC